MVSLLDKTEFWYYNNFKHQIYGIIKSKGEKQMNEETEQKKRQCLHCGLYEPYYTKGLYHFESLKKGYCRKHDKIVEYCDGCEKWRTGIHNDEFRKKVALKALCEILMNLSAIRQILQECQEEEKELK